MKSNKVNIDDLKTVKNYALDRKVSTTYIYTLTKANRMDLVTIDGVQFIDKKKWPELPTRSK